MNTPNLTQSDTQVLTQTIRQARSYCQSRAPLDPEPKFSWSERMTISLGIAYSPRDLGLQVPLLNLSAPIARAMVAGKGIESACEIVHSTFLHEWAHLMPGGNHGHGPGWQANMRKLGCDDPQARRYHYEVCGKDLYSTRALRAKYRPRAQVVFEYKGLWYAGRIVKHNIKTITVLVRDAEFSNIRIPWATVEESVKVVTR